jgi:hypothetical protein
MLPTVRPMRTAIGAAEQRAGAFASNRPVARRLKEFSKASESHLQ